MSKKIFFAIAFTVIISLAAIAQNSALVAANFMLNPDDFSPRPTIPPAHEPTITIENPKNMTYRTNNVQLKIAAATSQLDSKAELYNIAYYLDGIALTVLDSAYTVGPPSYIYYANLNLTEGKHTLQAIASARNWDNNYYNAGSVVALHGSTVKGYSDIVNFEVNSPTSTYDPAPTSQSPLIPYSISPATAPTMEPIIEQTAVPTSTLKQQTGFLGTNLPTEYGYSIIIILIIAVVAGLSLVHFKKPGKPE